VLTLTDARMGDVVEDLAVRAWVGAGGFGHRRSPVRVGLLQLSHAFVGLGTTHRGRMEAVW
jgi:hypothetical protein